MSLTLRLRLWVPALVTGLALAVVFGGVYAWRNPGQPTILSFLVMTVMTWPILTMGLQVLWFDRHATDAEIEKSKDDVERAWWTEAGATSFFGLMGGLIAIDTFGSAFRIPWLSPIGLTHVVILGVALFGLSYFWVRTHGR